MKRRAFLGASLAALGAAEAEAAAEEAGRKAGDLYELRVYTLPAGKQKMLDAYLGKAYLPALKGLGVGPVGVFAEKTPDALKYYVLAVHQQADMIVDLPGKLAADAAYRKAAAKYLAAPAGEPVYDRIDSSVLTALEGMRRLKKPDTSKPRLLNLRVYESHNERAGKKKIEMFNKAELAIFRRVGLTPVFFAETVVGRAMPNLTYMLVFPDEAGRKAAWDRFRADPEWLKLRAVPEYADKEIVSHITNLILTPTAYSEI
jgi:hypothetical protein